MQVRVPVLKKLPDFGAAFTPIIGFLFGLIFFTTSTDAAVTAEFVAAKMKALRETSTTETECGHENKRGGGQLHEGVATI